MSVPVEIPVCQRSINRAVIYKLLKVAAAKYEGCKFTYNEETDVITFHGPAEMHQPIIEEVLELFNK